MTALHHTNRCEAVEFGEKQFRSAQRVFGREDLLTGMICNELALVLVDPDNHSSTVPREDLLRAEVLLQENRNLATQHCAANDNLWIELTDIGLLEEVRRRLGR